MAERDDEKRKRGIPGGMTGGPGEQADRGTHHGFSSQPPPERRHASEQGGSGREREITRKVRRAPR